jgi:hypothetical protein
MAKGIFKTKKRGNTVSTNNKSIKKSSPMIQPLTIGRHANSDMHAMHAGKVKSKVSSLANRMFGK